MNETSQTLLVIFVAVAAISILMQAGFTLGIFLGARKTQKKLTALADDLRIHALPMIQTSREMVQDFAPKLSALTAKVDSIADNLSATSATLRSKTDQIGVLVGDVATRTQGQVSRVDGMVKVTLDQVTSAVQAIEHGIAAPVRQVNGIINGLRAGVEVLRQKNSDAYQNHHEPEDDLFV
jgi:methyl-accepting chemotaxis protein